MNGQEVKMWPKYDPLVRRQVVTWGRSSISHSRKADKCFMTDRFNVSWALVRSGGGAVGERVLCNWQQEWDSQHNRRKAERQRARERERQSGKTQPGLSARHCPGLNVLLWLQRTAAVQARLRRRARRPRLPSTGTSSEQRDTVHPGETFSWEGGEGSPAADDRSVGLNDLLLL